MGRVELAEKLAEFGFNGAEDRFVEMHQVHLVDRDHQARDAQQRGDIRMPARLLQHSLRASISMIASAGRGGSRGHVAGVLFVAGSVGDDELSLGVAK